MNKAMNFTEELMNILPKGFFPVTNCSQEMIQLLVNSKFDQMLFFSNGNLTFSLPFTETMSETEKNEMIKNAAFVVKEICTGDSLQEHLRIVFMTQHDFSRICKGYYIKLDALGLYAVPYLFFKDGIQVQMNHFLAEKIGLTEDEIFKTAYQNLKMNATIKRLDTVILDLVHEEDLSVNYMWEKPKIQSGDVPVFIISNKEGLMGAASIIHSDVQNRLEGFYPDGYYILPSSKHECLAIDAKLQPVEELKRTVQEVNQNVVSQEEWLSDTVYVVKNHILEIA